MTPAEAVARLRALHKAATPGVWRAGDFETDAIFLSYSTTAECERVLLRTNRHVADPTGADSRAIVAAHNAMPLLLAVAEAAARYDAAKRTLEAPLPDDDNSSLIRDSARKQRNEAQADLRAALEALAKGVK